MELGYFAEPQTRRNEQMKNSDSSSLAILLLSVIMKSKALNNNEWWKRRAGFSGPPRQRITAVPGFFPHSSPFWPWEQGCRTCCRNAELTAMQVRRLHLEGVKLFFSPTSINTAVREKSRKGSFHIPSPAS